MLKYFIEGGPLFMGMLSVVLLVILVTAVVSSISIRQTNAEKQLPRLSCLKSLGLFALVLGMLGQFLGLFQAFDIISQGVEISPKVFTMGLKISSITSIYGMIIFLIAYLLWFILKIVAVTNKQA